MGSRREAMGMRSCGATMVSISGPEIIPSADTSYLSHVYLCGLMVRIDKKFKDALGGS